MSLVGALDTAVTGLKVAQLQVQNAANNIANASNPEFTRKTALTAPINLAGTGGGVQIVGYTRAISKALSTTLTDAVTSNAQAQLSADYFANIKDMYGLSVDTVRLQSALSNFSGAWQSYASAPESTVRQREIISAGDAFAQEIRRISSSIGALDASLRAEQEDSIEAVNDLLERIGNLNDQVAEASAIGESTGNLEDQRDTAIRGLAAYMNVRVLDGEQGRIRLITPSGFVMLDLEPVELQFNGTGYETTSSVAIDDVLTGGKLQALSWMREDGSPAAPNTDPAREVVRKLRSQLDTLANSFITTTGTPATFAAVYNAATQASGELAAGFFGGTGAADIAVHANLLAGTANVKRASGDAIVDVFADNTRDFTADGLTLNNTNYAGYISTMVGIIGSAANTVQGRADLTAASETAYRERYANVIGVNVDEELVSLTRFQSSYSAVARVVTVVQQMLEELDTLLS